MNAIARTIRTRFPLVSFTTRGFLSFLLVVGLILLIIFLPEVTGIHVRRNVVEEQAPQVARELSPLNEILEQLNEMSSRKPFAPSVKEEASQAIHAKGATWEVLRSDSVKAALLRTKNQVAQLIESVPAEKAHSRFALANYQLALEQISAGRDDRFSAAGALGYLRHLDEQVTESFRDDQIDGPLFRKWYEVSLGDALQTAENRRYREGEVTQFNPDLTLNRVRIQRVLPGTPVRANNFGNVPRIMIEGSVLFRGTKKLSLYHNQRFVQDIEIPRPRKRQADPHVFFVTETEGYEGTYSFRAESEDREVFIRSYKFFPKITALGDGPKQVEYKVGPTRQRLLKFDRYFFVGERRPDSSPEGLARF